MGRSLLVMSSDACESEFNVAFIKPFKEDVALLMVNVRSAGHL